MSTLRLWQHQARTFITAYLHSRTFTIACLHFWCFTYKSWVLADSDAGDPQSPLIPDDTSYLSLTSDSGLPMDIANGIDLSLGFLTLGIDSTNGDGFDLGSSMAQKMVPSSIHSNR